MAGKVYLLMIKTSLIPWDGQGFGHTCGGERVFCDFIDLSNRCEVPQKASSEEGQCQGLGRLNGVLAYPTVQVQHQSLDGAGLR